jgi:hypothetical protein
MSTTSYPLRRALAENSTSAAFTAKVPIDSVPSGAINIFDRAIGVATDTCMPAYLQVIPFGADANDEAFAMRVWGWSKVAGESVWVPQLLVELDVTLGNIAATALGAGSFMADTIAIAAGDQDVALVSPGNDTPASALVHLRGCSHVEFDFDVDSASSANCLWRVMDQE